MSSLHPSHSLPDSSEAARDSDAVEQCSWAADTPNNPVSPQAGRESTPRQRWQALSLATLRQWHWVSSALCLAGMILFAVTGITLNNAAHIPAEPVVTTVEGELSPALVSILEERQQGPLPLAAREWLRQMHGLNIPATDAEWEGYEVYLALPRPGGDAWLSLDLDYGEFIYEETDRGTISFLNDLHKGRNTGIAWSWFLDLFSIACLVFSLSGLWLLVRYTRNRPGTWPMVTLGLAIPALVVVLSMH